MLKQGTISSQAGAAISEENNARKTKALNLRDRQTKKRTYFDANRLRDREAKERERDSIQVRGKIICVFLLLQI